MIALFKVYREKKNHIFVTMCPRTVQYHIHNNSFERDTTDQCRFYDFTFYIPTRCAVYYILYVYMRNGICSFS